jgi:hypothetical protein
MTNDVKIVGRLCQTPWHFTETPYNVEPALMKGRGGTPVPPVPAVSNSRNGGHGVTRPTKRPPVCDFPR